MKAILNDQQRHFVEGLVAGLSKEEAYRAAFPKCSNSRLARGSADRLLAKPYVQDHLAQYRAEIDQQMPMDIITLQEILEFLTAVLRTPVGKVDVLSKLCQGFKETKTAREIEMPDKLGAIGRMSALLGWNAPEKLEHDSDGMMELLLELRSREAAV